MRADRLLKLADFLETIPRKAFDIGLWVTRDADKPEGEKQGDCGFAGCAVGWAGHARLFRGLKLHGAGEGISYRGLDSFNAVDSLFGFKRDYAEYNSDAGHYLFDGRRYDNSPTPKQVAKRIRKFVADNG